jgi:hypothetical protein
MRAAGYRSTQFPDVSILCTLEFWRNFDVPNSFDEENISLTKKKIKKFWKEPICLLSLHYLTMLYERQQKYTVDGRSVCMDEANTA